MGTLFCLLLYAELYNLGHTASSAYHHFEEEDKDSIAWLTVLYSRFKGFTRVGGNYRSEKRKVFFDQLEQEVINLCNNKFGGQPVFKRYSDVAH